MSVSLLFRTIAWDQEPVSTRKENRDMDNNLVVGVDVAKDKLDIAIRPLNTCDTIPYTEEGLAKMIDELGKLSPKMIVVEATGGP